MKRRERLRATRGAFLLFLSALTLSPAASGAELRLAWDPSRSPDVAGYRLYYGPSAGVYPESIDVGNRTSYLLSGLKPAQTYYIAVAAYDTSRTRQSAYSNEVRVTIPELSSGSPSRDRPGQERFVAETVAVLPDFSKALVLTGSDRLLVAEKGGFGGVRSASVHVVEGGRLLSEPLVTLAAVETRAEMGLLGIALHPDYATNRLVYMLYTDGRTRRNRVVRFSDDGLGKTDGDTTLVIDDLPAGACGDHQGGALAFGPDGMLYIGIGDNGCDPCLGQNLETLAGKIVRYRPDGSVPADNPFGSASPIFAAGLRNAFDLAFQPETESLFATENGVVGRGGEINEIVAGQNYGWPFFQCRESLAPRCETRRPSNTPPVACYTDVSLTGLGFHGRDLLLGDFKSGTVQLLRFEEKDRSFASSEVILSGRGRIMDLAVSPDGWLYVLTERVVLRLALDEPRTPP